MFRYKKSLLVILFSLCAPLLASCSQEASTKNIRATLFLLDASKSMILSIPEREQQLKERLTGAFEEEEAIYFDFIRSDFTKQVILPLVSMQSIINVNDQILTYAKDENRRKETKAIISDLWEQSISDAKSVEECIKDSSGNLEVNSVLAERGARVVAQNICTSAGKAKETMRGIRTIGSGGSIENSFIGSDIEGAFIRGLKRLESESGNLFNSENERVGVRATIVVSSDMVQRRGTGERIIDVVRDMTEDQLSEYVTKVRGQQEFRELRPIVKIDGWLSTKKNFSEKDRQTLELYWKKWFTTLDLDEPDFGFGVMDWSVDQ